METLRPGSTGPNVQLLQTALSRAGYGPVTPDGIFGPETAQPLLAFQSANGLMPDAVAGGQTHTALMPYYLGYKTHIIKSGDSLYRLSIMYGSTVRAIEVANPGLDPLNLRVGAGVIVPLPFNVIPTNIAYTSTLISFCCRGLQTRYPFIALDEMGKSVMGKPLYTLALGTGENRVFYNAAHHANEWITIPVLLRFTEELARGYAFGLNINGHSARGLLSLSTLCVAPAVNPDAVDLVTGVLKSGNYYDRALEIASAYPFIPFPDGWKANILGTDLNLQYPAQWELAREIKFEQGFTSPAPRDYVGPSPLSAPESRAVYDFTLAFSPAITLSYHTQGNVIYWKYADYEPYLSREIAEFFGELSGYAVEETPYGSGSAGYKDWFIQDFGRPGYTIECGLGENPLPISQFDEIYADNLGILTAGLTVTAEVT